MYCLEWNNNLVQVTYPEEALRENIGAFVNALLHAKPAGLKKSKWFALGICDFLFIEIDKMGKYLVDAVN